MRRVRKSPTKFTKQFKLEAVRLMELGDKSPTQLALDLGIDRARLYKWQKDLRAKGTQGAFKGPGGLPLSERSEVERLRHELAKVKEERDILKKAAAYFAKDLP